MRDNDIKAIGDLAGDALAGGSELIEQMHLDIAARPFGILGEAAEPVRVVHDGITIGVHRRVRGGLRAAFWAAASLSAQRAGDRGAPLGARPGGAVALGALNGLYGNHIAARGNELALGMEIRRQGGAVATTPSGLAGAFPDATPRIAMFIHGLCETDESWGRQTQRGEGELCPTYGERLQDELGFTPVHVRYNSGLRISDNGRRLAALIDAVVAGWPLEVSELVLVGHSMGGLLARSACHYAAVDDRGFASTVRHVFCLGAPHLGADLEKAVNAISWACGRVPETRALGSFLNARSVGIKDLRFGSCVEEDWRGCDPDEFLRDRCREVPFLPGASYYFIAASLSDGPLGVLLGDLLVRVPSATGRAEGPGRRLPFEVGHGRELHGLNHFDLLNHPAVYEQLRAWIGNDPSRAGM